MQPAPVNTWLELSVSGDLAPLSHLLSHLDLRLSGTALWALVSIEHLEYVQTLVVLWRVCFLLLRHAPLSYHEWRAAHSLSDVVFEELPRQRSMTWFLSLSTQRLNVSISDPVRLDVGYRL